MSESATLSRVICPRCRHLNPVGAWGCQNCTEALPKGAEAIVRFAPTSPRHVVAEAEKSERGPSPLIGVGALLILLGLLSFVLPLFGRQFVLVTLFGGSGSGGWVCIILGLVTAVIGVASSARHS